MNSRNIGAWRSNPAPLVKTVYVASVGRYDGGWPSENGLEFLAWFQEKFDTVPVEFRESLRVEIGSASGYGGDHDPTIEISYQRPETPQEVAARLEEYQREEAQHQSAERAAYEALKAKYG